MLALPITVLGGNFEEVYSSLRGKQSPAPVILTPEQRRLQDHIQQIGQYRQGLQNTFDDIRTMFQAHPDKTKDFHQMWASYNAMVINGLSNMEDYLSHVTIPDGKSKQEDEEKAKDERPV